MRGNKLENHIFIFWNQKLWVENPKLMNMHNRLSIQSLLFANYRPIITSCQKFYTLGGEERRRIERMMSMCFTWFPISGFRRTQYITGFGLIYKEVECYLEGIWLWRTRYSNESLDVPEVLGNPCVSGIWGSKAVVPNNSAIGLF